jgi:uncharacterized membrane protein
MRAIIHKYRFHLNDREFLFSFISALVLLATSLVVNFYAGHYATEQASNPVTDIILSNIPVFDVDGIFVYGAITFWIFVIGLTFLDPKKIPFTLKSIALFTFIRSVFISLTHLGPFASQAVIFQVMWDSPFSWRSSFGNTKSSAMRLLHPLLFLLP